MFAKIWPERARFLGITGDLRPPNNPAFAAALGLALSACIAIRTAMEIPRSGDFMGAVGAGRHAILTALHLVSVLWRG
jgi:hypothetical protein